MRCERFACRHLLTLAQGFRLARGTEDAVIAALERPTPKPRVLVIPQWCVDPPDLAGGEPNKPPPELPPLGLEDLRNMRRGGTAGLCHKREGGGTSEADFWFGASAAEEGEGEGERGALRGATERRQLGDEGNEIVDAVPLLRSNVADPVLVVDLWSAPALFLRYVEVGFCFSQNLTYSRAFFSTPIFMKERVVFFPTNNFGKRALVLSIITALRSGCRGCEWFCRRVVVNLFVSLIVAAGSTSLMMKISFNSTTAYS